MSSAGKDFPDPDVVATQILVVGDLERARAWWVDVLGASLYREYGGTSAVLSFAGTWILLVTGGPPTADKPAITFAPPADPRHVSHAMTLRVGDCQATYEALVARGATFLTPPHDWGGEIRAFLQEGCGINTTFFDATGWRFQATGRGSRCRPRASSPCRRPARSPFSARSATGGPTAVASWHRPGAFPLSSSQHPTS